MMTTVNYNLVVFILTMLNSMLGCVHARPNHADGIESDLVPQVATTRATTKMSLDDGLPMDFEPTPIFNEDAENFWESCKFPRCVFMDEETGSARVSCRSFRNTTRKRIYKVFVEPYCYDALVTDVETGTKVMIQDGLTREYALQEAIKALIKWLISSGHMTESTSCLVPAYSSPLVLIQGSCPPGTGIKCDTVCEFACSGASYTMVGNPTIKCKPNTTLSDVFPRCQAKKLPTTTTKTASSTKHVPDTTTTSPPSTTKKSPSTKRMNSSTTENALTTGNQTTAQSPPTTKNPLTLEGSSTKKGSGTSEGPTTKDNPTTKIRPSPTTPRRPITLSHSTPKTVPSTSALPQTSRTFRKFGFIGILGVPLLLLPVIYIIYKLRHRHDKQQYRVLDENTVEDDIVDIPPDADGLYKDMHISPALPTDQQLNREECYPMDQRNKGLVFILNNYRFGPDRTTERTGSDVDLANVKHVFTEIGYTADESQNLTAQGIRQKLKSLTRKILTSHTSVVLVFMSHGKKEGIQGTDEGVVTVEEIKDMFSGNNCPALIGKPKIMIFQACRGEKITPSAPSLSTSAVDNEICADFVGTDGGAGDGGATMVTGGEACSTSPGRAGGGGVGEVEIDCSVADNADMFIAQSTSEGMGRNNDGGEQNGSWFIQALCEELIASAHDHHLDDIMTKVTDRVKRQEGYMVYQRRRQLTLQTPQIIKQGIGKKIFFLPKYPPPAGY
ncbi:uncharacterized protein LOC105439692 [Strongylocentrotus purpuratus]|uniref:Uncharacterized protein n=1 Tax=Strongylocentrotus purpuratus TaxID=7668 RepID=A0A7M7PDK1_STRPU|nr:uncharacterized protein LOC105439692 [Strongylocentrotus purpuratus]